ncbi:MAG: M20/M25/M40 family metallo-hydrolase [Bdellovibrionota bacterium]
MRELFKKLISINSVVPNEQEVGGFVFDYLKNIGFDIQEVVTGKDRRNFVATHGASEKYVAFYGHLDTVPPDPRFEVDPFTVRIEGDIAKGLGTSDMKGGLSCILKVGEWAVEQNLPVKIIIGVDEENISEGAHDLVNSGLLNDLAFLMAAESGQYSETPQPVNLIYGRKGRIVFDIKVYGKSAHAADKAKGINAIEEAAKLITAMKEISFAPHKNLGSTDIIVESIQAKAGGLSLPAECIFMYSSYFAK